MAPEIGLACKCRGFVTTLRCVCVCVRVHYYFVSAVLVPFRGLSGLGAAHD